MWFSWLCHFSCHIFKTLELLLLWVHMTAIYFFLMDSISSWIFEVFFCFLCFSSSTKCLFSSLSGFVSVVHLRGFPQMSCSPWLCLLSFKSEALRHIGRPKCIYWMYLLTCEHHWLGDWSRTERSLIEVNIYREGPGRFTPGLWFWTLVGRKELTW